MQRNRHSSLSVPLIMIGIFSLVAGCASKQVSTSVVDQAFEPGQPKVAEAPPPPAAPEPSPPPPPMEETRVAEAPVPPPPAPEAQPPAPAPEPPPPPAPEAPPPPPPAPVIEQPAAAAPVVELVDAYFDFDRFVLRPDAREALERNGRVLKSDLKDVHILIEGHCDEVGTAAYNLVLGEKRAQAAKRYLEDLGVPASRMQTASYGKERPVCTEHSPDCWQKNRRVHFAIK